MAPTVERLKSLLSRYFPEKSIAGNAAQIYVIQFFSILAGVLSGIIIARVLGPAEKGVYNLYTVLGSFISEIGMLGIGYGFLYQLANKNAPLEKVHGSALVFSLGMGGVTALAGWAGLPLLRPYLPGLQDWMILLPFWLSPATYYVNIWPYFMIGANQAVHSYRINLVIALATLAATSTLWLTGRLTAASMIWTAAGVSVLNCLVAFNVITRIRRGLGFDRDLLRHSLSYGFILYVAALANVIHFKVDQVMVNYWLGADAVGVYALSVFWAEKLFLLDGALLAASLHRISSTSHQESSRVTNKVFRAQLLISGLGGLALAVLAYPLVMLLYGEAYRGAILPLVVLIPGIIAWSLSKVHSGMLNYNHGLGAFVARVAILGSLTNILLNALFLGVLHWGITASAAASSLSYILVAALNYWKSKKVAGEADLDYQAA
jgi:O-antigen/teichoic acid export membrane protein